jgi:gliding motility-associated peptidyl-prolyl isomerase
MKSNKISDFSAILLYLLFLYACGPNDKNVSIPTQPLQIKKSTLDSQSVKANKYISAEERQEIDNFVKRRNWKMTETATGLRYAVYKKGNGVEIESGDVVTVNFEVSLLNGTVCYSSKETGSEDFVVDHDIVESGLHEALKLLRQGDKAKIILPSHLAYGLTGDMKKIPPYSTLVYDIEVLKVGVYADEK